MNTLKSAWSTGALAILGLGLGSWSGVAAQETETIEDTSTTVGSSDRVIPRGPGNVSARLEADSRQKETTFDFPGIDRFLTPWTDWKSRVGEEHKFRPGFDYQPVSQWSDNSEGEDSAVGGILRAFTTWDLWNRDNLTRSATLDVRVEHRHTIGSGLPPENLAPNFGWIGVTAPDWSNQGLGLPVFMLRQRLDVGDAPIELRVGRMTPFAQFDITPYSDNLTTFQNNSIILNPTIGYPSAGSFGVGGYVGIPRSKLYVLGMVMDANGSYDELGLDSLADGQYFSAVEFGWTQQEQSGLMYLFNNFHVGLWHRDGGGKGITFTGTYTFWEPRIGVFARYGKSSDDASTLYSEYAAAGVTKSAFGDSMFGVGVSWGTPQGLDNSQVATEFFYRWQMSQNLALTPSVQFLNDPVLNAVDSSVTVFSLRLRLTL
jgi:porin